jgi:hypothetical protein
MVYARRASQWKPEAAQEIETITQRYVMLRYGTEASAQDVLEFERSVSRFAA